MDFLLEDKLGFEYKPDIIYESETEILKKKIMELEKQLANSDDKYKKTFIYLSERIDKHDERLNRHHLYFEFYKKNMEELFKKNLIIHKNINNLKSDIEKKKIAQDINLEEIIQKQKLELKDDKKQILELNEITDKPNKKRSFDNIKNDYIEKLNITKKRSKPWSKGMSKYTSIIMLNGKWRWETIIFEENYKNFSSKEEAEKYYETIIAKYNIDPIHITRVGYNE